MNIKLTLEEARVMGSLLEKAVTTPDQYPLTLNALTNACNQKSSRDPVMNLEQGEVQRTTRNLEQKYLLSTQEGKVEKYTQRLCNTLMAKWQFDTAEYAIITLMLLRGAQTPGELRSRAGRLHNFADNHEVIENLQTLMDREEGALVARLPKKAGRQDHEYTHLFSGHIESVAAVAATTAGSSTVRESKIDQLEARVVKLENALIALADKLGEPIELGGD